MTKFSLTLDADVRYSKGEQKVFGLLSREPATTTELTEAFYDDKEVPFNGRKIVVGLLSSLKRKVLVNKEKFAVSSTKRAGPHPISFFLEEK